MEDSVKEIRINDKYTNFLVSTITSPKDLETGETEPVYKKRTIFTEDFSKKLFQNSADAQILPPNVRYLERLEKGSIVIVEEPPAIRTIFIRFDIKQELNRAKLKKCLELYDPDKYYRKKQYLDGNEDYYRFTLAMPYIIHFLAFGLGNNFMGGSIFFRKSQLRGLADGLYKAPFTNINAGQNICYGSNRKFSEKSSLNLAVENVLNSWWSSVFNTDYSYNYNLYVSKGIEGLTSYLEWQYYSKKNPLFIYDVPWVEFTNQVEQQISKTREYFHGRLPPEEKSFSAFTKVLSIPIVTGKTKKVGNRTKRTVVISKDICQSYVALDAKFNEYVLEVGHQFENNKGEKITIDCFNGISKTSSITSIQIDRNGKCETWRATDKVWDYIISAHRKLNYESKAIVDGVEVKTGDIISLTDPIYKTKTYRRVGLIRKSRDNKELEIQLSGNYYFGNKLKDISLLSFDKPKFNDLELVKGKEYVLISTRHDRPSLICKAVRRKFRNIDVTPSGNILFTFQDQSGESFNVNIENQNTQVLLEKDLKPITTLPFYSGFGLFDVVESINVKKTLGSYRGRIVNMSNVRLLRASNRRSTPSQIHKLVNKNRFFISGPVDQEYKIGDTVISVDFLHPLETLKIRTITSFVTNKETGDINFILKDKHGKVYTHNYIDGQSGSIRTGSVRKIVNNINGIHAGTKIIAKESKIARFPKKDVNIIIGFIIDTGGEPMVLCSNCSTLWFSDLEKFELYPIKSKKWKTLEHTPIDLSKFKLQSGDLLVGATSFSSNNHSYLAFIDRYTRLRSIPESYVNTVSNSFMDSYPVPKLSNGMITFATLPTPRLYGTRREISGGIPNMFGLIYDDPNSTLKFEKELRRI